MCDRKPIGQERAWKKNNILSVKFIPSVFLFVIVYLFLVFLGGGGRVQYPTNNTVKSNFYHKVSVSHLSFSVAM